MIYGISSFGSTALGGVLTPKKVGFTGTVSVAFTTASPHVALDALLVGSIASAFTTIGLLDAGGVPSGSISSIFSTASTLTTDRGFAGSIDSVFTTTGYLNVLGGFLGSINSVFTTTGDIELNIPISGTIDSVFTTVISQLATEGDFTGSINSIFDVAGNLSIDRGFEGSIDSVFTTLGRLYTEGSILSGTINSQFSTGAYLHYTIAQSGTIASVFTTDGESKFLTPLSGSIDPVFDTDGYLRFDKGSSGSMDAVFTTNAAYKLFQRITGSIDSIFTADGLISYTPFSGTISSVFAAASSFNIPDIITSIGSIEVKGSGLENEDLYRFFLSKGGPGLMQGDLVVSRLGDFPAGSEASIDVHDVRGVVTGVSEEGEVDVKVTAGSDKIKDYGQDLVFVQVGSVTDDTRDSLIEIMQDDVNAPYIQIRDGIDSFTKFDDKSESVIFRAGVLTGLTHPTLGALTGKGTYVAGQGYYTGAVHVGTAGDTYDTDTNTWTQLGTGVYIGPEGNFRAGEAGGDGIEWDNDAKTLNISAVEFKITATDMIVDGTPPAHIAIGNNAASIDYLTNEGIWMGQFSGGDYRFRIGGHSGAAAGHRQRLTYSAEALTVYDSYGVAIFKASEDSYMQISGWNATEDSFKSTNGSVGLSTGQYAFWAGNSTPANAETWIQSDGSAKFTDVLIEGNSQVGAAVLTGIDNIPLIDVVFSGVANSIQWSAGSVVYAGQSYDVDAGNTSSNYLLWSPDSGISHDGNGFDTQNNVPTTGGDTYLLAYIGELPARLVHTSTFLNVIYADLISVSTLSSLNANVGTLTAGLIRSGDASSYMDLDATASDPFLVVDGGAGATLYFDGSGDLADGNISWDASGNVTIYGSVTLANTISAANIIDVAPYATGDDKQKLSELIVDAPGTGSGLFMDATHLGYYETTDWNVYIGSDGTWKLKGDDYNYLQFLGGNFSLQADTFDLKANLRSTITDIDNNIGSITVYTDGAHTFVDGDSVLISEVLGMTDLNGTWPIFNATDDQFDVNCSTGQSWTNFTGAVRNLSVGIEITDSSTVTTSRGISMWDTNNPKLFMGDSNSSVDWNVTTADSLTVIGGTITGSVIETGIAGENRIGLSYGTLRFTTSSNVLIAQLSPASEGINLSGDLYVHNYDQESVINNITMRMDTIASSWNQITVLSSEGITLTKSETVNSKLFISADEGLVFGTAGDVNLFREDANTLKTQDVMDAVGGFAVDGSPGLDQSMTIDGHSLTFTGGILTSYGVV